MSATVDGLREENAKLARVAAAAKNLVAGARDLDLRHASVSESALVLLETALAAAGYDLTEEEFAALTDGPLEPEHLP